jgi:hypothetical protein
LDVRLHVGRGHARIGEQVAELGPGGCGRVAEVRERRDGVGTMAGGGRLGLLAGAG